MIESLGSVVHTRRVLAVGSEGDILADMLQREDFCEVWRNHYGYPPTNLRAATLPNYGQDVDLALEATKAHIAELIHVHNPDVVLISAGTAGKILIVELAEEHDLPVLDFGACLRGVTYSGSPGYRAVRMDYIPFIWKLPIQVYMEALEGARPEISREECLVRALCQTMLAGVGKTIGKMCPIESYERGTLDTSLVARAEYLEGRRFITTRFGPIPGWSETMREEWQRFESWATWTGIRPHARYHQTVDRIRRKAQGLLAAGKSAK